MSINIKNRIKRRKKKLLIKRFFIFLIILLVIFFTFLFFKIGNTFSLVNDDSFWTATEKEKDDNYEEKNRIDIMILGIRGDNDELYGAKLSDSIMILSIETKKKKSALISIPRDLYVKIPKHAGIREKINYTYAFGENKNINGVSLMRQVLENVTGIDIDYGVVVDFKTFKNLIDNVGGINIYLEKEFLEKSQWGWEFRVPAGNNLMNGETALYYARSRFSTNDFDRSRRQQEIIVALKNKILSMGVLTNPIKINDIFNSIGEGVNTNIDLKTAIKLIKYINYMNDSNLKRKVLDTSDNGLLQAGMIDGQYVLYPKVGLDDFNEIKKFTREIFD